MRLSLFLFVAEALFGLAHSPSAEAQWFTRVGSAGDMALAYSDVTLVPDAANINPAVALDTIGPSTRLHATFSPLPNGLESSWSAAATGEYALAAQQVLGAHFEHANYADIYSADELAVQYSKGFRIDSLRHAVAGVRLRYAEEAFGGPYLPIENISVDVGASFDLLATLQLGAAVMHLANVYSNQAREVDTLTSWIGLSYEPLAEVIVHAALESREGESVGLRFGAEYTLERYLKLRFGVATATNEYAGGIGIHSGDLTLDFALLHHPELGSTLAFGISYGL